MLHCLYLQLHLVFSTIITHNRLDPNAQCGTRRWVKKREWRREEMKKYPLMSRQLAGEQYGRDKCTHIHTNMGQYRQAHEEKGGNRWRRGRDAPPQPLISPSHSRLVGKVVIIEGECPSFHIPFFGLFEYTVWVLTLYCVWHAAV